MLATYPNTLVSNHKQNYNTTMFHLSSVLVLDQFHTGFSTLSMYPHETNGQCSNRIYLIVTITHESTTSSPGWVFLIAHAFPVKATTSSLTGFSPLPTTSPWDQRPALLAGFSCMRVPTNTCELLNRSVIICEWVRREGRAKNDNLNNKE